jgi:hypothetical protein
MKRWKGSVLYINKWPIMDAIEKYHIYVAIQNGIQINGTDMHNRNPTFDTLCKQL